MFDCYVSTRLAAVLYNSVSDERECCIAFDCYVTDNTHTILRYCNVRVNVLFCFIATY